MRRAAGEGPEGPGTTSWRPPRRQQSVLLCHLPGASLGLAGFGSPLLVTPLAAGPWGWRLPWVQLRSQLLSPSARGSAIPSPSFFLPPLDREEIHGAKLNQEKPVQGARLVSGEAFPQGAWAGCSGYAKNLLSL